MPKKKRKKATELTTDELAYRLFPKEVVEEIRRVANEPPKRGGKPKGNLS